MLIHTSNRRGTSWTQWREETLCICPGGIQDVKVWSVDSQCLMGQCWLPSPSSLGQCFFVRLPGNIPRLCGVQCDSPQLEQEGSQVTPGAFQLLPKLLVRSSHSRSRSRSRIHTQDQEPVFLCCVSPLAVRIDIAWDSRM